MEELFMGEEQFRKEFKGKVSPEEYFLMLEALKNHRPGFSRAIFEIIKLAIEKGEDVKDKILEIFQGKPKNSQEIRKRIMKGKELLDLYSNHQSLD